MLRRSAHRRAPRSTTAATSRCTSRRATSFEVGVCADPRARPSPALPLDGRFSVAASSPVRGIATSGWRGRSFSLGIADSVTVLATTASRAPTRRRRSSPTRSTSTTPRIVRAPGERGARRQRPRRSPRHPRTCRRCRGARRRRRWRAAPPRRARRSTAGRIIAAVLSLQGRWRVVGEVGATLPALAVDAADRASASRAFATSRAVAVLLTPPKGHRMLYPASAAAPEVDVRKLVCTVEDVWHDNGPRLATPLRRGSLAAVLKNPYAGRYVEDIQPMMEALKPLGREMAARLVEALGGAAPDRGLRQGRADRPRRRARARRALARARRLRHARPARGLARDRAVDDQDRRRRRVDRRADPPPRRRLRAQPFRFASRCASPTRRGPTRCCW